MCSGDIYQIIFIKTSNPWEVKLLRIVLYEYAKMTLNIILYDFRNYVEIIIKQCVNLPIENKHKTTNKFIDKFSMQELNL